MVGGGKLFTLSKPFSLLSFQYSLKFKVTAPSFTDTVVTRVGAAQTLINVRAGLNKVGVLNPTQHEPCPKPKVQ